MFTHKPLFCLIAALVVVSFLVGVPSSMAGAYDTGDGQGYASCAGTEISRAGTILKVVRLLPDVGPIRCQKIDRLQRIVLLQSAFRPVAYYLQGVEI